MNDVRKAVKELKLVIIAGGKGTRLGLQDSPKPMVLVGGRPLLEHQINLAKRYGIRDITILSGHLSNVIADYFGDGRRFGVSISHRVDRHPLGTAGAVKQLEGEIKDRFVVFYGDLFLDMDMDKLKEFDLRSPSLATIVVHPNDHPYDSDLVEVNDGGVVTAFHPKHRDQGVFYRNLVNAAVYILGPEIFRYIPADKPTDFGKDIFPHMVREGTIIRAYNTAEYIKDIGTTERLHAVSADVLSGKVERSSKRHSRPAIFLDRDGTLVEDVDLLHRAEDLKLYPFSGSAVKKINTSDYLCFLVTNQPVVARNLCDTVELRRIHNKLETLLAREGAYLDNIYFCPHHPDRGYPEENRAYKIDCDCRKPKPGMIKQAESEFNVDLQSSWLIGDTTTDVQTGRNAGMQTIVLRTGKGGKDGKFSGEPDFVFDDLAAAVDFILAGRHAYELYSKRILERVNGVRKGSPRIISIAGPARSGKSTFMRLLSRTLRTGGLDCADLSLDNWLIGMDERSDDMTVRERYKYHEIERDIKKLLDGEEISMNLYDPFSRKIIGTRPFSLNTAACLIIDGVPALDIELLRNISDARVYVETDENTRRQRFFSFYRWKGLSDAEIERLYRKRQQDEAQIIQTSKKYADVVVEVQ